MTDRFAHAPDTRRAEAGTTAASAAAVWPAHSAAALMRDSLAELLESTKCKWALGVLMADGDRTRVVTAGDVPDVQATAEFTVRQIASPQPFPRQGALPVVVMPVRVAGQIQAVVALGAKRYAGEYTPADRALVAETCAHLAVLLGRKALTERLPDRVLDISRTCEEMRAARGVQQSFLPTAFPHVKGLDYHGDWQPAHQVGGDFFDFLPRDDGLAISIGDVAGKGVPAAIMMAGVQASLRVLACRPSSTCTGVVHQLNRVVCRVSPDNLYATLFYAHVDPGRGRLTYVSAGHEPALLVRRAGGGVEMLESTGTVLGLTAGSTYRQRAVNVECGDFLIAFTDGISEAIEQSTGQLCHAHVIQMLQQCPDMTPFDLVDRIMSAGTASADPDPDDRTVVAVHITTVRQDTTRALPVFAARSA